MRTKPIKDDVVKVVFHNGLVEEGVVVEWGEEHEGDAVQCAVNVIVSSSEVQGRTTSSTNGVNRVPCYPLARHLFDQLFDKAVDFGG